MPSVLADTVAEQIRQLVAERGLAAGERLPSERELATRLGVSRPTVREGLRRLSDLGVVDVRRKSGVYVTPPDLSDLLAVRLRLEPLAAALAATHRSSDDAARLAAHVEQLADCVEDGPAFAACDEELHAMIAQMGPNAILRNVLDQLAEISAHSRAQTSVDIRTRRAGLGPMLRVVDAIVAGDPEGAERAMVDHLRATVAAADTAESVPSAAEGR